jgi:ankyrin repeat protein
MRITILAFTFGLLSGPVLADDSPLAAALQDGDLQGVEAALAAGAPLDAPFPDGLMTPLGLAITQGDVAIVRLLLDSGAPLSRQDVIGLPPLSVAVHSCKAGREITDLLIERGAEIDARGAGGMTPLLVAALMGRDEIVASLIAAGADTEAVDVFGDGILNFAIYAQDPGRVQVALASGSGTAQLDRLFLTRGYRAFVWPGPPRCPGDR